MALPFSYATLAQALSQLAQRLYDPNFVFWTQAELTLYLQESLQTFNALAQYWRGDFQFNIPIDGAGYNEGGYNDGGYGGGSIGSTTWFDLTQVQNTLRPFTVNDYNIYTIIEYHLLEPPSGGAWSGTSQFTINDLINAVQRRRDEILTTTGCTVEQSMIPAVPGQVRNYINDYTLDVRRIAWFPTQVPENGYGEGVYNENGYSGYGGFPNVLWPEDMWSFQAFENGYTTISQGTPQYYALSTQPPLSFDTDVAPQQPGQYELLTVDAGTALTTASPTIIPIPNDFIWVLKWGALADLLSREAEAKDEYRASYANHRYQQGMKLLAMAPAILQMRVNNIPIWIDAVRSADEYHTDWQAQNPGVPENVFVAGLNLIAFSPAPNDTGYSAKVTVVQNAPLPSAPGDFIQVSRGDYDAILDYAVHLAMFKCGGAEFEETKELYNRFVKQCALNNAKLNEQGLFEEEIYGLSNREEKHNPRLVKSYSIGDDGGQD